MDLYYRDPQVFLSEFQNSPLSGTDRTPYNLEVNAIARRITGLERGVVPNSVDKIVAFIDTQMELLYYVVMAWTNEGRSYVIDYGACPDQGRLHWSKEDVPVSLPEYFGEDFETYLRGGLTWLTTSILENSYQTADGAEVFVDQLAIDAAWGESTDIIRRWIRESPHRSKMHASMGKYIGATTKPWQKIGTTAREKDGLRVALVTPKKAPRGCRREMQFDTNFWKSFVADRLTISSDSSKAMCLFNAPPSHHRMIAEHCHAEEPFRVQGKSGKEFIEWKIRRTGLNDNDFFDCLVGCCALANVVGAETHIGNKKMIKGRTTELNAVLDRKRRNQFFKSR
jgi:phage terminase large subunit GpA-like protein